MGIIIACLSSEAALHHFTCTEHIWMVSVSPLPCKFFIRFFHYSFSYPLLNSGPGVLLDGEDTVVCNKQSQLVHSNSPSYKTYRVPASFLAQCFSSGHKVELYPDSVLTKPASSAVLSPPRPCPTLGDTGAKEGWQPLLWVTRSLWAVLSRIVV